MNWIIRQIHKETWSPYAAGILLGIVGILSRGFVQHPPGRFRRFREHSRDDRKSHRA